MSRILANNVSRIERLELARRIKHGQHAVFRGHNMLDPRAKCRPVKVAQPDRMGTSNFISVARPDAAAGRSNVLAVRRALIERTVLGKMPGKDHMRPIADPQIVGMPCPALRQL